MIKILKFFIDFTIVFDFLSKLRKMNSELVLWIISMCAGKFLDFETRLCVSAVSKRFRKICWSQKDQSISIENHTTALLAAWSIAIDDFVDGGYYISILYIVRRLPRCCRKYRKTASAVLRFVRDLKYEVRNFDIFKVEEYKHLILDVDVEDAKAFISKFVEAVDRKGYRPVIGYDKVTFVPYKTPVQNKGAKNYALENDYKFDRIEEIALSCN